MRPLLCCSVCFISVQATSLGSVASIPSSLFQALKSSFLVSRTLGLLFNLQMQLDCARYMAGKAATKGEKVIATCSSAPSVTMMSSGPCQGSRCMKAMKAMKARQCFSTSAQTCSLQAAQRYLPPYSFLPAQVLLITQAVKECVSTSIGLPKCEWIGSPNTSSARSLQ